MASSYSTNTGLEKVATGEQSNIWGATLNTNFDLIDEAGHGQIAITLPAAGTSGAPNALAISDGVTSEGRHKYISFVDGGDLGAAAYVQLTPNNAEKICIIQNGLSGDRELFVFQGTYNSGRAVGISNGQVVLVKFSGVGATATAEIVSLQSDLGPSDAIVISGGEISGVTIASDSTFVDSVDDTKVLAFDVSGIATGTTRTWTYPDSDGTFVGLTLTQTLTNKTLTDPTINAATLTGTIAGSPTLSGDPTFTGTPDFDGDPTFSGNPALSGNPTFTGSPDFSGVGNAATIRTDLGLEIGTDLQAYDANLASLAGLTLAEGDLLYATGADTLVALAKGTADQVLTMNAGATAPEWQTRSGIVVGTYTGDGSTSQAITGVGFTPKFLQIMEKRTTSGAAWRGQTDTITVDDGASGGMLEESTGDDSPTFRPYGIVSLDADGFTVSDNGSNDHPNESGRDYNYIAMS